MSELLLVIVVAAIACIFFLRSRAPTETAAAIDPVVEKTNLGYQLLYAIFKKYNTCEDLINAGADLTVRNGAGFTALGLACQSSMPDVAMLILAQPGVDIETKTTFTAESTPLMMSCSDPNLHRVFETLLALGANVRATDNYGTTALHYAHSEYVVTRLLNMGADINAVDTFGLTALFGACRDGKVEVALCLIHAGADKNMGRIKPLDSCNINNPKMATVKEALLAKGATW
jgi:ankyrin repeat protein